MLDTYVKHCHHVGFLISQAFFLQETCSSQMMQIDSLKHERDQLRHERDVLKHERDSAHEKIEVQSMLNGF